MLDALSLKSLMIRPATVADRPFIQQIVAEAWPAVFGTILSSEFLQHELTRVYADAPLQARLESDECFLIAWCAEVLVGFSAYRIRESIENRQCTLENLYLMPALKGKGYGAALLQAVIHQAMLKQCDALWLNVNRGNPAVRFYERQGFSIVSEVDIPVGQGFVRNDYVMRRLLVPCP